ncbi:MAG TPA: trypsin-like peptidase domain-containing protein [Frankiaceae bacterium]|jgi:S1-C subfamily serine protease|nr:trypsin-like peptidase domain-containing protein [Frankiaceae bacterium]
MTDHGDWWSPQGTPAARSHEPWHTSPMIDLNPPLLRRRDPDPRPGRLLAGIVAGAAALAVAIAGGGVVVDHHSGTLTSGLPGIVPPAANTSATNDPTKPTPAPHTSTTPAPILSVPQVAGLVEPGVVVIDSQLGYQNAEAAGTGMVLSPTGEILTNNHVIDGATYITVTISATQQRYVAHVVGTEVSQDVAVLQLVGASGLTTIPLGDSDTVASGQPVVGIGNAGGSGTLSIVTGNVTDTDRSITASDQSGASSEQLSGMIEVQAPIMAGDSGGPLANRAGKVIGMDTAASASNFHSGKPTYGFAIPINRALSIAAKLNKSGAAQNTGRGYLGIQVQAVNPGSNTGGAEVISTNANSPAAGAGIEPGDIITSLNGESVTSADGLTTKLEQSKPGQLVTVGWNDEYGEGQTAQVTLSSGPAD